MAAPLVVAEALHLEYPTKVVFDAITLGVEEGDRVGIVGRNGDGNAVAARQPEIEDAGVVIVVE